MIVKKAAKESSLALEYAIVCKEISELYEPVAGSGVKINQFVYLVTNQVQTFFNLIRLVFFILLKN